MSSKLLAFTVILMLALIHLASCKPTPMGGRKPALLHAKRSTLQHGRKTVDRGLPNVVFDARKFWSESRKTSKKIQQRLEAAERGKLVTHRLLEDRARRKRQTSVEHKLENEEKLVENTEELVGNATGGRYMWNLYQQILNSPKSLLQANSVKSLNYEPLPEEPKNCNKFKFSMAGLTKSEFIMKTLLRLYLQRIVPKDPSFPYIATIKVEQAGNSSMDVVDVMLPTTSQYVEFGVADIFRLLVGREEKSVTFTVEVYKDPSKVDDKEPIKCEEIQFSHSSKEDQIPLLLVYSFDRPAKEVNITQTDKYAEKLRSQNMSLPKQTRRKRNAQYTQHCGKIDLHIDTSLIPPNLIGLNNFKVFSPQTYNAHICGGVCSSSLPHSEAKRHLVLINVLRRSQLITVNSAGTCCAPIAYESLLMIGMANGVIGIHTVPNMVVKHCACTDIVQHKQDNQDNS